jgi:hypothetical protein
LQAHDGRLVGPKAAFGATLSEDADDAALFLRSRLAGRLYALIESKGPEAHPRRVNVSRPFYGGFAAPTPKNQNDRKREAKVSHMHDPARGKSTFRALGHDGRNIREGPLSARTSP